MNNIYFWEKPAKPRDDEDTLAFHEIPRNIEIREIIRNLEDKILGATRDFNEIKPSNPSIKTWIVDLIQHYPTKQEHTASHLINLYRSQLQTRSRERERFIIGLLQLEDIVVLIHSRKDLSLAEVEDRLEIVRTVLNTKNIIRADIVKRDLGKLTLSAFASSRRWSKGHASLWGIDPEDIGWDRLGEITLSIQLESFSRPLQMPLETDELSDMLGKAQISATGGIWIGREPGKIIKVSIYRKDMDFSSFYGWFITQTEKLESFQKKFNAIIKPQKQLNDGWGETKYRYQEDMTDLYELTTGGQEHILTKENPRFTICFFTKDHPGIQPTHALTSKLYEAVFENRTLDVWHAGEQSALEAVEVGNLKLFNKLSIPQGVSSLAGGLLNQVQDANSKKAKCLLQYAFCELYSRNLPKGHFRFMFDFLVEDILRADLSHEFKHPGFLSKEGVLEFKSADDVDAKPSKFAKETLAPAISGYVKNGIVTRYCILYGIEDNGAVKPIIHLKSDQIGIIQATANAELGRSGVRATVEPIPCGEGRILSVFITPVY
jgi:hypothetical protein